MHDRQGNHEPLLNRIQEDALLQIADLITNLPSNSDVKR